jgi:hypothetical protein
MHFLHIINFTYVIFLLTVPVGSQSFKGVICSILEVPESSAIKIAGSRP